MTGTANTVPVFLRLCLRAKKQSAEEKSLYNRVLLVVIISWITGGAAFLYNRVQSD